MTLHNLKEQSNFKSNIKKNDKYLIVSDIKSIKSDTLKTTLKTTKVVDLNTATWYNLHGNRTASGEVFHRDSLTAAYNFCKLGTLLRVTNLSNNECVIVKVNDRMGYKGSNRIDLSKCAFDSIGNISSGKIKVKIELLN
jgi:rare lipoprotein A (peptidoglycan hydrolase)